MEIINNQSYLSRAWENVSSRVRSLIERRQAKVPPSKDLALPVNTSTEIGTAASASPRVAESSREFVERYDRRSVIFDVRRMLADNPLLAQAAQDFVDTAVSKSFEVNVEITSSRGVSGGNQKRAQRILERFTKDANIRRKLPSWGRALLSEGDLFIQCVEHRNELVNAKKMPTASMERLTDAREVFNDANYAFRQVDISTNEIIAQYALWQIVHGRWNHVDGERYGNSQYLQLRRMSKIFLGGVIDMAVRRRTRGPARRHHKVGTPDAPGEPKDVEEYMALNSLKDIAKGDTSDIITMDYFSNGMVEIKDLSPDARLRDIEDIQFILNVLFPRSGMTKGLIGFGENVSRDILDEQREFVFTRQDLLIDALEWDVLRPIYDLALLIEGVNPDSIVYGFQFEERMTEAGKMAKVEMYMGMYEAGLMTEEQLITRIAPYINVRDVKQYLEELKAFKLERQEAQLDMMTKTAKATGKFESTTGGSDSGDAEDMSKRVKKSTLGTPLTLAAGGVKTFTQKARK